MKPSEKQLSEWVNGNLTGAELSQVEKWADECPDEAIIYVESVEVSQIKGVLPNSIEPPYADFFNAKLAKEIAALDEISAPSTNNVPLNPKKTVLSSFWLWLAAPSALALMALCFLLGMNFQTFGTQQENLVYVPSERVKVTQMYTEEASMIVLEGLEPLSDDLLEPISQHESKRDFKTISVQRTESNFF